MDYNVSYKIDDSMVIKAKVVSMEEAIEFGKNASKIAAAVKLGRKIGKIVEICNDIDGVLIPTTNMNHAADLRLAMALAVVYPNGLSNDMIEEKLGIPDKSRRTYVSTATKRTSKYLVSDKETKTTKITRDGIGWVISTLEDGTETE